MLDHLKSYFVHNRSERIGTIALIVIVILILAGSEIFSRIYKPESPHAAYLSALIDSLELNSEPAVNSAWHDSTKALFKFDPNTLSDSGYAALGFTESEISTLRKYQAAGGVFREKNDFAKLYFVDDHTFQRLEPYIDLPDQRAQAQNEAAGYKSKAKWSDTARFDLYSRSGLRVDLNTADTLELDAVHGIGPFYARLIVERRVELGGFHSLGQLMELWNMKPESIDVFADHVWIDVSHVKKIPVNTATAQELSVHPYISSYLASRIVLRREDNGPYRGIQDMVDRGLLDAQLSLKLAPYLLF